MNRGDRTFVPGRLSWLLLAFALALVGCSDSRQTAREPNGEARHVPNALPSADQRPGRGVVESVGKPNAGREPVGGLRVDVEKVRALQRAVDACGGVVQLDGAGRPVLADFVSPRAPASVEAFDQVVATPTLKVLRLIGSQVPEERLGRLTQLSRLTELVLQDAPVTDHLLAQLADRLPLTRLTLRNAPLVTDDGLTSLAKLKTLTRLALIDSQIEGTALQALARLPRLTSLDLRQCPNVGADDLLALADAPRLSELKLGGYQVDTQVLAAVAKLPRLKSLTVEDASVDGAGLRALAHSQAAARLEALSFARCSSLDDDALTALSEFPNLRQLVLKDLPVTGTFLSQMPWLENLQTLVLSQTFADEDALASLRRCRSLKRLELAQVPLTERTLKTIAGLTSLEQLDLSECGLNDEMVEPLRRLPNLRAVRLDGNPDLSPETLQSLVPASRRGL